MIICRHLSSAAIIAIAMLTAGCDSGNPSRTADEFAADSALAADLALANRDTLLVDSIGAYREPDAAEQDTAPSSAETPSTLDSKKADNPIPAAQPAPAATPPAQPAARPPETNKTATATASSAPRLTGTRACRSPTPENQAECLRASIATVDARLNRVYRALITEMRRQEGVPTGAKDPPSVQRLRVAQRAWLVYRDTECRRRGRGSEGALWARPRARCLGQFATRRANELADNFSRLTAR